MMRSYLSEHLSAPDRLDTLLTHIEHEISRRQRSRYASGQRIAALLGGSAMPADFAARVTHVYPQFPDASTVGRNPSGITQYLNRLVGPDGIDAAREVICDYIGIEDLEQIATDLTKLSEILPQAADALLELRIGRGRRLLSESAANLSLRPALREEIEELKTVVPGMARLHIAYVLRGIAMRCGAQIHAPLNWSALDAAEKDGSGGSLRVSTLLRLLEADLSLAERLLDAYTPAQSNDLAIGLRRKTEVEIRELELDTRARVQLHLWRAQHGNALYPVLDEVVSETRRSLMTLRETLATCKKRHAPNTLVGHMDRANAGVCLYLAVEEAIDWTADRPQNQPSWIDKALMTLGSRGMLGLLPEPLRIHEKALSVGYLFEALRIAFLRDIALYRIRMQQVWDPTTSRMKYQAPDPARQKCTPAYSFEEIWNAWEASVQNKTRVRPSPHGRTSGSNPGQIDSEIKRNAIAIRKDPASAKLPGAFDGQMQLRDSINAALTAA
ncbi:hypothetical protein U1701_17385 [Sphingomonas sp. PB2P19]|uniref:hypothetical protein n=1 Tax=Sphingomonas rhamnosi TaxID=3096156 RepID=UPI002FCC7747